MIKGECSCNFTHIEKADCKQQGFTEIPPIFQPSITSLNLEKNQISYIDPEQINRYVNLTIISLRFNQIRRIKDYTFANLSRLTRLYDSFTKHSCFTTQSYCFSFNLTGTSAEIKSQKSVSMAFTDCICWKSCTSMTID